MTRVLAGALLALGLVNEEALARDDFVMTYLQTPTEEKPCVLPTSYWHESAAGSVWFDQLGTYGMRALFRELDLEAHPLESSALRLDLEGLLAIEEDDGRPLTVAAEIYGQNHLQQEELSEALDRVVLFYKSRFNVVIKPQIMQQKLSFENTTVPSSTYKVVFLEGTDWPSFKSNSAGFADPENRTAYIRTSEANSSGIKLQLDVSPDVHLPDEERRIIRLSRAISHELAHCFGLPDSHTSDSIGSFTPRRMLKVFSDSYFVNVDNLMDFERYTPDVPPIGAEVIPLQVKVVRSYLRGGIVAKESPFTPYFWSRVWNYLSDSGNLDYPYTLYVVDDTNFSSESSP